MSTELATRDKTNVAIQRMLEVFPTSDADARRRFSAVALGIVGSSPELSQCSFPSKMLAVYQCAKLGLIPDKVLGHVYVIPFKDQAQVIIGYKGFIELARRSGKIGVIRAAVVSDGDEFFYDYGQGGFPRHIDARMLGKERGKFRCAYAVAESMEPNGRPHVAIAWREDIDRAMQASRAANSGPWQTDFDAMAMKTAVRRLAKFLPLTAELGRALEIDEMADRGEIQKIGDESFILDEPKPDPTKPGAGTFRKPKEAPKPPQSPETQEPHEAAASPEGTEPAAPAQGGFGESLAEDMDTDSLWHKCLDAWMEKRGTEIDVEKAENGLKRWLKLTKGAASPPFTPQQLHEALGWINKPGSRLKAYDSAE